MKKFTKVCVILAAVLMGIGLCLMIGSAAGGATWSAVKKEIPILGEKEQRFADVISQIADRDEGGGAKYQQETGKAEAGEYADIEKIEVDLSDDAVEFLTYEGSDVRVEVQDDLEGRVAQYEDGGKTLKIESHGRGNPYSTISVYLPADSRLKELEIRVKGGTVDMPEGVEVKELQAEIGAGTFYGSDITAQEMNLTVGAGTVEIENLDAEEMEIGCGLGTVSVLAAGRQEDYSYELTSSAGAIYLGDGTYSGIGVDKKIKNAGASNKMEIDCGAGTVEVQFEQ